MEDIQYGKEGLYVVTPPKIGIDMRAPLPCKGQGGFTIVELMVAAVIILIAVIAIVAISRTSTDLQVTDHQRRQARAYIAGRFETQYGIGRFPGPYVVKDDQGAIISTVDLRNTPPDPSPPPFQVTVGLGGINPFPATLAMEFKAEVVRMDANNVNDVPVHIIEATLTWPPLTVQNPAVDQQTVRLSKQLSGWR